MLTIIEEAANATVVWLLLSLPASAKISATPSKHLSLLACLSVYHPTHQPLLRPLPQAPEPHHRAWGLSAPCLWLHPAAGRWRRCRQKQLTAPGSQQLRAGPQSAQTTPCTGRELQYGQVSELVGVATLQWWWQLDSAQRNLAEHSPTSPTPPPSRLTHWPHTAACSLLLCGRHL